MKKTRVLLVDDHMIVREGMRRLLEVDAGIEVVGEASSGEEALVLVRSASPDVVLMDIRLRGMEGIAATRQIKKAHPHIEVIVLTSYADEYLSEAIEAGASGYLVKSVGSRELRSAIQAVRSGETIVDRSLGRELFARFGEMARASKGADLSDRELEIVTFLASGLSGKDIAARLFISETTLKRELRHIYEKLGVSTRAQVVGEAYKRNLL